MPHLTPVTVKKTHVTVAILKQKGNKISFHIRCFVLCWFQISWQSVKEWGHNQETDKMSNAQVKTTKTLLRSVNYLSCLSCVHKFSSLFPLNSSSRSIKRRKFDDELVESSLNVGTSSATPSNKLPRTRTPSLSTAVASSDCKY